MLNAQSPEASAAFRSFSFGSLIKRKDIVLSDTKIPLDVSPHEDEEAPAYDAGSSSDSDSNPRSRSNSTTSTLSRSPTVTYGLNTVTSLSSLPQRPPTRPSLLNVTRNLYVLPDGSEYPVDGVQIDHSVFSSYGLCVATAKITRTWQGQIRRYELDYQ